jgi:hypothetical protein
MLRRLTVVNFAGFVETGVPVFMKTIVFIQTETKFKTKASLCSTFL